MKSEQKTSEQLLFDMLAVVIQLKDGRVFQVALTKEMSECLYNDLELYFDGGKVQLLPGELKSINLENTGTYNVLDK